MPSVSVQFDQSGLDGALDGLEREMLDLMRPAAQAGAQVFYEEVVTRVNAIGKVTGNLASSIYQAWSRDQSVGDKSVYHISWNARKAPHGHLVEYGHMQRYASYVGDDGRWYTAVRSDAKGKKRPGRRASQSEKDAYYVLRPGGEKRHAAQPFIRSAYDSKATAVGQAAAARYEDGMRELLARIA